MTLYGLFIYYVGFYHRYLQSPIIRMIRNPTPPTIRLSQPDFYNDPPAGKTYLSGLKKTAQTVNTTSRISPLLILPSSLTRS